MVGTGNRTERDIEREREIKYILFIYFLKVKKYIRICINKEDDARVCECVRGFDSNGYNKEGRESGYTQADVRTAVGDVDCGVVRSSGP